MIPFLGTADCWKSLDAWSWPRGLQDVGSDTRAPIQGGEMRFLAPLSGGPMHEGFSG